MDQLDQYNALGRMIMLAITRSNAPYLTDRNLDPPRWVYVAAKLNIAA